MHLRSKAEQYCSTNDTNISRELGFGTQGIVFKSGHNTAIKVYNLQDGYRREKSVYKRLEERKVHSVQEMSIPRIVGWDDELLTFEMSIVHVPCVIDFGGAYLDTPPDHMTRDAIWETQKSEEFGENWERAKSVIREIEHRVDIWLADINTGNIKFE